MDADKNNVCGTSVVPKEIKVSIMESGVNVIKYVRDESVMCSVDDCEEHGEFKNDKGYGLGEAGAGTMCNTEENDTVSYVNFNDDWSDVNDKTDVTYEVDDDVDENDVNYDVDWNDVDDVVRSRSNDKNYDVDRNNVDVDDDVDSNDEHWESDDSDGNSESKGNYNMHNESESNENSDSGESDDIYEEYEGDRGDINESLNSGVKRSRANKKNMTIEQKVLIRRFYNFLKTLKNDLAQIGPHPVVKKYRNVMNTCASVCDISRGTIAKVIKQNDKQAKTRKAKTPKYVCSEGIISTIRRTVLDFYVQKQYPKLDIILAACKKVPNFPHISRSTLCRWMLEKCNFEHKNIGKKPIFLEREDVKQQRKYYLTKIKSYREEGYYVVYQDETWASPDLAPSQCWQLLLKGAELTEFLEYTSNKVLQNVDGYTGGFLVKGGQGRVIINHAGGAMGFVSGPGVEDVFISKKDSADYHSSMNAEHFNDWFKKLVNSVEDKTVIVLDRAPYHRDRVPSTVMCKMYQSKGKIIESLHLRNIEMPEGVDDYSKLTKKQLIAWSEKHFVKVKYEIERIAELSGKDIRILWLPVAHCELNPIELIWSVVKGHVASNNSIGGTKRVKELSLEAIRAVTPKVWKNCCDHAIKEEEKMRERDRYLEAVEIDADISKPLENLEI